MSARMLIVEDDPVIASDLSQSLEGEGFSVDVSTNGEDGFFMASTESFDVMLLDIGLPGRDGLAVLKALRQINRELPVLILSSHGEVRDRVTGLTAGADDYLVKPFAMEELFARLQCILRRGRTDHVLRLVTKDLHMDLVTRKVSRAGRVLELTFREFEILEYLMRHARETVSRAMLACDVWKQVNRATSLDNVIDVHMGHLRKKVDTPGSDRLIHTVRGIGFCLSEREPG